MDVSNEALEVFEVLCIEKRVFGVFENTKKIVSVT